MQLSVTCYEAVEQRNEWVGMEEVIKFNVEEIFTAKGSLGLRQWADACTCH